MVVKSKFVGLVIIGLFLYWVVQSPLGAAEAIESLWDITLEFLELIATRFLQFLDALL